MIFRWFRRRRYLRFTRHAEDAIRRRLLRGATAFAAVFALHVAAMALFEGFSLGDAAWLTMTTATTVGYGDFSATTTLGRLATVACMYLLGIYLLAQAASDLFDYRAVLRERQRRGEFQWKTMKSHLLIINVPRQDAAIYLSRLVDQVRRTPAFGDIPIQLLTPRYADGLPPELVERGVAHYTGIAENTQSLAAANAASARCILLIADEPYDPRCDAHSYDILSRLAELERPPGLPAPIIVAEVVDDANRERIRRAGATTTVRPVRAYPELAVRALAAPGVEQVLETLFTHDADRLSRFDTAFENLRWADVVAHCVAGGAGIPMAYAGAHGIETNPLPGDICSGSGIITLLDERLDANTDTVAACLARAAAEKPAA